MAENWVRCRRCYNVFDAEEGACPKCGTPYVPPATTPQPIDGLYTDRYADMVEPTEAATPDPSGVKIVAAPVPSRRTKPLVFVGGGLALIGGALIVAIVAQLGGGPAPNSAPIFVRAADTVRPRLATLPPIVSMAVGQVGNPQLNAHVTMRATIQLNSQVKWKTQSLTTTFDGHISEGNQSGTVQTAGAGQEIRLVGGLFFARPLPSGKWTFTAEPPTYLLVGPVLGVTSTKDLISLGPAIREGQMMNHLQTSTTWTPDISRLTMTDLSTLPIQPTSYLVDLWVDDNGVPLSATVQATNIGPSGAKLLDIEVTYTFSDVGVPVPMVAPISPSPSPSTSPTASSGS